MAENVYFKTDQEWLDQTSSWDAVGRIDLKPYEMCPESEANLVSSLLTNMRHSLVLDIDHEARLVPSSTPGHYHLFIDVEMTQNILWQTLRALQVAGVVEPGFVEASIQRGFTAVRHNCKKPEAVNG